MVIILNLINIYSFMFLQKQVAQFTKVLSHVWEIISKGREDWEGDSMRAAGMGFIKYVKICFMNTV